MVRGRKPKCFGYFTNDDEINRLYGNTNTTEPGWSDASFYCMTRCPHAIDCMTESERLEKIENKELNCCIPLDELMKKESSPRRWKDFEKYFAVNRPKRRTKQNES